MSRHRHHHAGRSSRDILNADEVATGLGLKDGMSVLDLGCGDGNLSIGASRVVGDRGVVHALDVDEHAITSLRSEIKERNIQNIHPMIADATRRLPLDDGSIDCVLVANVMHGFVANDELDVVLPEVRRVLKESGLLGVVEFKKVEDTPGPPLSVRLPPAELDSVITPFGFRLMGTVGTGQFHYLALYGPC